MTVVASYGMVLCGNSSDDLHQRYRGRIEKVKFGVPINEAFAHDIPATLLVKVEDVQRFKLASEVVKNIITSFGHTNLFPRECYEFYARITGRTLRVDENWLFTFQYPSRSLSQQGVTSSAGADKEGFGDCSYGGPSTLGVSLKNRLSSSVGERTSSGSSTRNSFSCAVSSSGLPSSCGVRRRSWRVRSLRGSLLGFKTHSLDSQDPPLLPSQRGNSKPI
ncbi:hypothetical protein RB195_017795 [Necator americanus]|uniref:Uncharacterized protein n=1 Tax=Necator americanus TaxID=51031 RepID=A0ABR1CAF7_NECAM